MKSVFWWLVVAAMVGTAWHYSPQIRQTGERWTCTYRLGDDCVSQDDYMRAIAREQFELSMADLELFCTYVANRTLPRCSFFFQRY